MKKLIPFLFVAALLIGCQKSDHTAPTSATNDEALRTFLGIRSIDARFTLPDSEIGYYPVAIFFANGKEMARRTGIMRIGMDSHRQLPFSGDFQLLVQFESNQFRRAALVCDGNLCDLSDAFPYWQNLSYPSWRPVPMDEHILYQGVSILGIMAASPGSRAMPNLYGLPDLASLAPYVVAVGIVFGSDKAALTKRFLSESKRSNPTDDEK